jgi:hypothetical protein
MISVRAIVTERFLPIVCTARRISQDAPDLLAGRLRDTLKLVELTRVQVRERGGVRRDAEQLLGCLLGERYPCASHGLLGVLCATREACADIDILPARVACDRALWPAHDFENLVVQRVVQPRHERLVL